MNIYNHILIDGERKLRIEPFVRHSILQPTLDVDMLHNDLDFSRLMNHRKPHIFYPYEHHRIPVLDLTNIMDYGKIKVTTRKLNDTLC